MNDPLIFLDVDGVLNGHTFNPLAKSNTIDRDKVDRLNRVIMATDARIVVSSAWRYHVHRGEMTLAGLDWLLRSHGVAAGTEERPRVLCVTRPDTMIFDRPVPDERGEQIAEWRRLHRHTGPYVVIDDGGMVFGTPVWTALGIPEAGHPLVLTMGQYGLTDDDADEAIAWLTPTPEALSRSA